MDKETLEEAVKEVADMFLEDVIRKGKLRKHMGLLPTFREHWAVLQPTLITLYSSSREKEVCEPLWDGASCVPATTVGNHAVFPCMTMYNHKFYDTSCMQIINIKIVIL